MTTVCMSGMPYLESNGTSNMWYSFNYGPVHFVSINTETDYPNSPFGTDSIWKYGPFGDQLSWLQNDLIEASANREQRPWIVVAGHRPIYTSNQLDDNGSLTGMSSVVYIERQAKHSLILMEWCVVWYRVRQKSSGCHRGHAV